MLFIFFIILFCYISIKNKSPVFLDKGNFLYKMPNKQVSAYYTVFALLHLNCYAFDSLQECICIFCKFFFTIDSEATHLAYHKTLVQCRNYCIYLDSDFRIVSSQKNDFVLYIFFCKCIFPCTSAYFYL